MDDYFGRDGLCSSVQKWVRISRMVTNEQLRMKGSIIAVVLRTQNIAVRGRSVSCKGKRALAETETVKPQ